MEAEYAALQQTGSRRSRVQQAMAEAHEAFGGLALDQALSRPSSASGSQNRRPSENNRLRPETSRPQSSTSSRSDPPRADSAGSSTRRVSAGQTLIGAQRSAAQRSAAQIRNTRPSGRVIHPDDRVIERRTMSTLEQPLPGRSRYNLSVLSDRDAEAAMSGEESERRARAEAAQARAEAVARSQGEQRRLAARRAGGGRAEAAHREPAGWEEIENQQSNNHSLEMQVQGGGVPLRGRQLGDGTGGGAPRAWVPAARSESPPLPGHGRSNYNLNFVDYDNESTDGEWEAGTEYSSDRAGREWEAYWEDGEEWTYERMLELDRHVVNNGGMRLAAIKALPTVHYGDGQCGSNDLAECAVCLERFVDGEPLIMLPCEHPFHTDCIRPWLRQNHRCPYCRFELERGDVEATELGSDQEGS
ncbi:hypothetical protein CYMTET_20857 [Cymbomonas tetramitiformis]|uniref:RING-type domain-containing protein n=1 Tax=Cymbomonas tetramitiformis TaxID=36881 RepID=A0AAE0G368_9CHLO|nr:hypothetical protein CYMTET_20857 [Cymbomonas tetramitiformis]